jgi:hypothetical protein
MTLVV